MKKRMRAWVAAQRAQAATQMLVLMPMRKRPQGVVVGFRVLSQRRQLAMVQLSTYLVVSDRGGTTASNTSHDDACNAGVVPR